MFRMRNRRMKRMRDAFDGKERPRIKRVSEDELFDAMGYHPETVN